MERHGLEVPYSFSPLSLRIPGADPG
jgi:hypothetical protein